MKRKLFRGFLFCLVFSAAFSARAQDTTADDWKRYELGKGNFNVLFPSAPKEDFMQSPPNLVVPIDTYISAVGVEEGALVAQYCILGHVASSWSDTARESFYDGFWKGIAEEFDKQFIAQNVPSRTTLVQKRTIKFSGYPGRELRFTAGSWYGQIWVTVVGRQAFGAMVFGSDKLTAADRQKFLNSFIATPIEIPLEVKRAELRNQ